MASLKIGEVEYSSRNCLEIVTGRFNVGIKSGNLRLRRLLMRISELPDVSKKPSIF